MRRPSFKLITLTISIAAVLTLAAYAWLERNAARKIDFIIFDYTHENEAQLTPAKMEWYITSCGANIDKSQNPAIATFNGLTYSQSWTLPPAPKSPSRNQSPE